MERCAENDLADILDEENFDWDAIMLQEGPARDEGSCTALPGGHIIYAGKSGANRRTTAVILHMRWKETTVSFCAYSD